MVRTEHGIQTVIHDQPALGKAGWRHTTMLTAAVGLGLLAGLAAPRAALAQPPAAPTEQAAPAVDTVATADAEDAGLSRGEAFLLRLAEGGVTMMFLLAASILGAGFALERLANLRLHAIVPEGLAARADDLWRQGDWERLRELPRHEGGSTLARTIAAAARHRHSSLVDVSSIVSDVASRDLRRHLERAYPLAIVATVAPLLGLFGTVIGMIGAFDSVSAAGALGDAAVLGGDIAKALITTAGGLAVAIPALAFYHYFKSRTQLLALVLEEEMDGLIGRWFGAAADAGPSTGLSNHER